MLACTWACLRTVRCCHVALRGLGGRMCTWAEGGGGGEWGEGCPLLLPAHPRRRPALPSCARWALTFPDAHLSGCWCGCAGAALLNSKSGINLKGIAFGDACQGLDVVRTVARCGCPCVCVGCVSPSLGSHTCWSLSAPRRCVAQAPAGPGTSCCSWVGTDASGAAGPPLPLPLLTAAPAPLTPPRHPRASSPRWRVHAVRWVRFVCCLLAAVSIASLSSPAGLWVCPWACLRAAVLRAAQRCNF